MSVIFYGLGVASDTATTTEGVGSAAATGDAAGVGVAIAPAVGTATASGSLDGVSAIVAAGVGSASGLGSASAVSEPAFNWPALRMLLPFERRRRRTNLDVRS